MRVRDCLSKAPVTVPPECTCAEAAGLMEAFAVGALLVVNAGVLVGIVTDRDIVVRGVAAGLDPSAPVVVVMTRDPVTIQGGDDVDYALALLGQDGFRRLPVLEDGELAGILTVDDVLLDTLDRLHAVLKPVAREAGVTGSR